MLIIDARAPEGALPTEELHLPFETRCRSRLRTRLASGEACELLLARGAVMRNGDHLLGRDGRVIRVVAAEEDLLEARTADPLLMARAAYHLGNRHVALSIAPGCLQFAHDHVLGDMVRGLGLEVVHVHAPFEPESGAYGAHGGHAHPHGHSADGEGRGPRIHDHFGR